METDSPASRDLDLLRRVASGEEDALAELYQKFGARVFHYLVQILLEVDVAEDLVQEVFIAIWRGAARFRGEASVKTWIFRIAHHQAVTWLRKNTRAKVRATEDLVGSDVSDERVFGEWVKGQVQIAVRNLSPDHRAVIELTFFHGMSYNEIAEIMACPVGTVKSRMSYARQYLMKALEAVNYEVNKKP